MKIHVRAAQPNMISTKGRSQSALELPPENGINIRRSDINVKCHSDVMLNHLAFLCAVLLILKPSTAIDYCNDVRKDCGGGNTNLVCRRGNKCAPTSNCKEVTLHKDVKDFLLDKFNDMRNKVALGQGPIQGGKKAANMQSMSWDEELAYIAQCAANVCEVRLKKACPVASKYPYAHIIYTNRLDTMFDDEFDYFNETVKTWLGHGTGMSGLSDFSGSHYDFAAIVMAKGAGVGCGWSRLRDAVLYHNYNGHYFFAACVFAQMPQGNVFEEGDPCTKCPKGTSCNSRYKALCGEVAYAHRGKNEDDDYYDYHDVGSRRCQSIGLVVVIIILDGVFIFYLS